MSQPQKNKDAPAQKKSRFNSLDLIIIAVVISSIIAGIPLLLSAALEIPPSPFYTPFYVLLVPVLIILFAIPFRWSLQKEEYYRTLIKEYRAQLTDKEKMQEIINDILHR